MQRPRPCGCVDDEPARAHDRDTLAINILRNTAACYAGAIAGADAITTVPFDAPVVLEHGVEPRNWRGTPSSSSPRNAI